MNQLSPAAPARIVLVEDDVQLARSTRRLLSDLGEVTIDTCYDVASARSALSRNFDVLVSDFHLPDGTGAEVLAAAASSFASAPRILVTANTKWECATQSINEGGAFRVLGKPCSDDVLIATVGHALAMKRENDARIREQAVVQQHHLEIAAANADLFIDSLSRSRAASDARHRLIRALGRAIDRRFGVEYTKVTQLASMARAFAAHIGVTGDELFAIESGVLLHRLGSIALRDGDSPEVIPDLGAEILQEIGIPSNVQRVVADYGERFDGTGLHGRHGRGIALGARILAVVQRYVERMAGREDRASHELVCLEMLSAEDLDPELVASFVVERTGAFRSREVDTLPFVPCLQGS
jgi:response regulator RpfG family c-di-GMP phosphodiesterase